jgi:hypothetical protein
MRKKKKNRKKKEKRGETLEMLDSEEREREIT